MNTSLDITRALKVSIRGLPKDWRRPPGRPRHTLAMHPGCRSPASQLWPQLSMEIRSGSRTLEAPRGNRYAPARGMCMMMITPLAVMFHFLCCSKYVCLPSVGSDLN